MIRQLGRYEVIGEIGQGAMGVVYRVNDPLIDRIIAVKTINLNLAEDEKEEYEGRFYQEAKAAGRLSHPNIVTIFDVGKSGDVAYIAMEYLEGRELRDILNDQRHLPIEQILDLAAQIARGLAYAHEHDVVHRDIKPANVMVVRDGHVKITDFGIARMSSAAVRTQTGMVLGSPKYMSPEQVLGKVIDQRSDVFSLGVTLYEMLTGQVPFTGENVNAIMYQTLNVIPAPPSMLNPDVPEMLNFIVAKALAKDLNDRYQNAREFANDLRACRDTMPRSKARVDLVGGYLNKAVQLSGEKYGSQRKGADHSGVETDESKVVATMGLSPIFDSTNATMRLAAMTSSAEEVEILAKTLQIPRPGLNEINKAALVSKESAPRPPLQHKVQPGGKQASQAERIFGSNGVLMVIFMLMIIGTVMVALVVFKV
ncbi:MAG: serine/threonine-protein kinase [Candidatus Nitrotoga sp.]